MANFIVSSRQLQWADEAMPTWDPHRGGVRPIIALDDKIKVDIGADPTGTIFEQLARRMLAGDYYPADAVQFSGRFRAEERELRPGDRIVQRAPLPWMSQIAFHSVAEIVYAERGVNRCHIGYVTTNRHYGRGIWQAELERAHARLILSVTSTAGPGSFWFWVGLPVARYLQLRARRRGIEHQIELVTALRQTLESSS